jgi:ankyrin repeat protein
MAVFRGTGTGTIQSTPYNIPATISSFSIVNIEGGNINVSVRIDGLLITALDFTLKAGQAYIRDTAIRMKIDDLISIDTSGEVEYYFTIE